MKKILALILAALMVLTMFACAAKTEPAKEAEQTTTTEPAEETTPEETAPAAEETTEEPEVAAEEPAPAKKKATKKKAEVTEESAPAKKAPSKKKAEAKVEEPVEENDEADKPKVVGKYTIEDTGYAYQFHLYANNGQLLYESREYASLNSCKGGIATFKKNVADCEYRIDVDKNGGYKYIFKKGNSIYIGETYSTAKAAERSAESVKRFAQVSEISE